MRWLFNHGITASELYEGVGDEICNKDFVWFKNNFDVSQDNVFSYLGYIFIYSFDLIITYIIENKVRFVGPFASFYIDFEMFSEEEFMSQRRNGRMKDIDLVNSDFTGYQLTLFYKYARNDTRYRKLNLYLGKKHKELFLNKVNSGERMYTIKDITLEDILPQIYEKFPKLNKKEVKKILYKGYHRMYYAIKQQCYMTFRSRTLDCTFHIGTFFKYPERQIKEYSFRMRMKLIKLAKWRKDKLDDYHFIGISKDRYDDWVALNNKTNRAGWCWVHFENVIARKQLDAVLYNSTYIYIFKVKLQKKYSKKWNHTIKKQKFKDVEFVGIGVNYKLQPTTMHWKELIKQYNEERDD